MFLGDGRAKLYFFKNFQRGGEEFETLWGNVFLGFWGGKRKRKRGKDRVFGLSGRWDVIWNIP